MSEMLTGSLRKKKDTYGFLRCDDGSDDCFFIPTSLLDGVKFETLQEGQKFEFEAYEHIDERSGTSRGRRARNIRSLES
jgi:cold shock CspA family protein